MNELKIALLQILPGGSLEENIALGTEACRQAAQAGADIALFAARKSMVLLPKITQTFSPFGVKTTP